METAELTSVVREAIAPLVERIERLEKQPRQEYFSISQAGAMTGLSSAHVRRAVTGGTLPCSKVGSHARPTYRISRDDIKAWMERRKMGALPPRQRSKRMEIVPGGRHFRSVPQRAA